MNRRNFAQSWGRKLFFGLSWPLSLVLGLIYLRSYILPASFTDWVYFVSTYLGHFGLLNVVVYFFLFSPFVAMMPSYYMTRLWSLILILVLNIFILADAICFSTYHLHLYSFLAEIFFTSGVQYLISSEIARIVIYVGMAITALFIWLRGEMIWRSMQGRFSNPVKNWYLVFIVVLLTIGKLTYHYGSVSPKLASLLPLDFNFPKQVDSLSQRNQKFYYSSDKLNCKNKKTPHIVMFVIRNWDHKNFNLMEMPNLYNMQKHSINYTSHINVASEVSSSSFSLFYSIPSSYQETVGETRPAFLSELEKRKYEVVNLDGTDRLATWLNNRSGNEVRPFFLLINIDASNADNTVQEMIMKLQKDELLTGSHILFTGISSTPGPIPFMHSVPERKNQVVTHLTTHYDVLPSFMSDIWGCKNSFSSASVGKPLRKGRDNWYLIASPAYLKIHDLKNESSIEIRNGEVETIGSPRRELIFLALKQLNRFNRP